jgi:hypothetical protein
VLLVTLPSTSARVAAMLCNWMARSSIMKGMIGLLEDMVVVAVVQGDGRGLLVAQEVWL